EELQRQIDSLQECIAVGQAQAAEIVNGIERERGQALGKAAPEILSARAVQRLRQIQRQNRGLAALLQDPAVQRMLKLNDEQFRKIEAILKNGNVMINLGTGTMTSKSPLLLSNETYLVSPLLSKETYLVPANVGAPQNFFAKSVVAPNFIDLSAH